MSAAAHRVAGVVLHRVRVPLVPSYVSSQAARPAIERVIVELETEGGHRGIGETNGTVEVFDIATRLGEALIGQDVRDRNGFRHRFAKSSFQNRNGRHGWMAMAGLEMALYDLAARRHDLPLHDLLGGAVRREIPVAGLMGAVPLDGVVRPEQVRAFVADFGRIDEVVTLAKRIVDDHGFGTLKIKSAGLRIAWDIAVMEAFRESFGPQMRLRQDCNGAWTPAEALTLCKPLERLGLEYYEDPTHGIDGLARLRRDLRTPIATNMYVVEADHLPLSVARDAIDVALVDVNHWGGVDGLIEGATACAAFGIEIGIHSHFELGVATACNLHLAAALPGAGRAIDSVLWAQRDDVVAGDRFVVRGGVLALPEGPGLGVELDPVALARLSLERRELGVRGDRP